MNSKAELKANAVKNIRRMALPYSNNNGQQLYMLRPFISSNRQCLYSNADADKDLIFHHLNNKFISARAAKNEIYGGKNLLYFSIFLSDEYVDLLEICLNSIVKNTSNINFDVLFITDESTKLKLQALSVLSNFTVDFMIEETPRSIPGASMKKLEIFEYEKINQYNKILFLDVDSYCLKSLELLFNKNLIQEKLYVSFPESYKSPTLLSPAHSLMYISERDAEYLYDNPDIIPFNAGQFLMINSTRMQLHFKNVLWLSRAWPDVYYYEQSFMNQYFVYNDLTKPLVDDTDSQLIKVSCNFPTSKPPSMTAANIRKMYEFSTSQGGNAARLLSVTGATKSNFSTDGMIEIAEMLESQLASVSPDTKIHDDSTVVLHFASIRPSGQTKKTFITNYIDAHKLHI